MEYSSGSSPTAPDADVQVKEQETKRQPTLIQIFLGILIIIGLLLILTQKLWVPQVVAFILKQDISASRVIEEYSTDSEQKATPSLPVLTPVLASTTRKIYSLDSTSSEVYCIHDRGYELKPILGSDAATFEVLGEFNTVGQEDTYPSIFAKDKNQVYLDCYVLEGVDPQTVSLLSELERIPYSDSKFVSTTTVISPYLRDARGIYYFGERIPNTNLSHQDQKLSRITKQPFTSDIEDFVTLGNHYAKDSQSIYYAGTLMEGVDYATFKTGYVHDGYWGSMYGDASDKEEKYYRGKKESENACEESEKDMPLAKELLDGKIVFIKDVVYTIGKSLNGSNCLDILDSIDREIWPPDNTNQGTFDSMVDKAGLTVTDLPPRTKSFTVERILEVSEDTMHSDGGPFLWVILVDELGIRYKMVTVFFGENGAPSDDQVIAILQYNGREYSITYDSFEQNETGSLKEIYGFSLSDDWVDMDIPLLSYQDAEEKVRKEQFTEPLYTGGGKIWFKQPGSTYGYQQSSCGRLSFFDINTRRYHTTYFPACSVFDIEKTKPFYILYCGTTIDCGGDSSVEAINLDTKRAKDIVSLFGEMGGVTLDKECYSNTYGGTSCSSDIELVDDHRLRVGIYNRANNVDSLSEYSNTKLRDVFIDLRNP